MTRDEQRLLIKSLICLFAGSVGCDAATSQTSPDSYDTFQAQFVTSG